MINEFFDKIIQGDCLEVFKKIPSNSVDMTFADPPFNLKKKYNNYKDSKREDNYLSWCKDWIYEMVRVTKPTGTIFIHNIPRWLTYYVGYLNKMAYFKHWITWDARGMPMGKTLLPNHYGILYYTKSQSYKDFKFYDIRYPHPKCRICNEFLRDYGGKKDQAHGFGPLLSDVWSDIHRIRHKKRRNEHPCQLSIPLLERLILMTTDEKDVVLDPFIGTGTTAVAAKQMGRRYIGIEIDANYVEITKRNIKQAKESKIGGYFVSSYLGYVRTIRNKDYKEILEHMKSSHAKENNDVVEIHP